MKSRRRNAKSSKRRNENQDSWVIPRPLAIPNVGQVRNVRVRYVTTGTVALAITYHNLLDSQLVATTAVAGFQYYDLVRIRAIEMWSYSPSGTTTISLAYVGRALGAVGDDNAHTDTSIGMEPAYLKAVPSKGSTASMFQPDTTNTAFNIYCPTATIIDVHFSFRTALEGNAPVAVTQALVGAQPGMMYFRGIDGAALASTLFRPQGTPQLQ